jgi:hypothetical protein
LLSIDDLNGLVPVIHASFQTSLKELSQKVEEIVAKSNKEAENLKKLLEKVNINYSSLRAKNIFDIYFQYRSQHS